MSLQFPAEPMLVNTNRYGADSLVHTAIVHTAIASTVCEPPAVEPWLPAVRDSVQMMLTPLLQQLLDRADDVFFDLAERAGGTRDQQRYFETMRVLRRERNSLERNFLGGVDASWTMAGTLETDPEQAAGNWTLVDDEDLEERLAIEAMAARASQKHESSLLALNARFSASHSQASDVELNLVCPVHPFALSEQWRRALQPLQLGANAKLAIYKLFEREVLASLGALFQAVNDDFIRCAVLPQWQPVHSAPAPAGRVDALTHGVGNDAYRQRSEQMPASETGSVYESRPAQAPISHDIAETMSQLSADSQQQILHLLHELLASQKPPLSNETGFGAPTVPLIETPQLLTALSQLQMASVSAVTEQTALGFNNTDLRALLAAHLPFNGARIDSNSIGVLNDDVIDIVSMMFDYILGDSNLADDIKAPLARLQIPMLKLAINDREFFSNRNHPARLLLNEMAYAGIGWDPERRGRDGLQGKVCALVQRVLNEFDHDPVLFENLLADFRYYVEDESRRSTILERRTREMEEGKARNEQARVAVDKFLNDLLRERCVPAGVQALLNDTWSRVLQLEHLRSQGLSESYRQHQDAAMLLVRSVDIRNEAERAELTVLIAQLLPQLRAGFAELALDPAQILNHLQMLEQVHLAALHGLPTVIVSERSEAAVAAVQDTELLAPEVESTDHELRIDDNFAGDDELMPAQLLADNEVVEQGDERPESIARDSGDSAPQISDELWAKVDNFPIGSWLQTRDSAGRTLRCKLAAKIPNVGRYVFVNRAGMKVLEMQREALALAMHNQDIKLLDDGALFDRALEAVIHNLRLFRSND